MKRKISVFICAAACILSLNACGTQNEVEDYNGYTRADLEQACEQTATSLEQLSEAEQEQYYAYYASDEAKKVYADLMEDWMELRPQTGDFIGYTDFEITEAGKTLSATLTADYSTRDLQLTYVLNADSMEVQAINVSLIYTMGETMGKAGMNTVMGIGVVFVILVLISLVIRCFGFIPKIQKSFGKKPEQVKIVERPQKAAPVIPEVDDLELIAVIGAAIAAETGISTDDFVVRSIRRRV